MDEASDGTLTRIRGYRNPEHEFVCQTRGVGPRPRSLPACRSGAQDTHSGRVLRPLRVSPKAALRLLNRSQPVGPPKRPGPKRTYEPAEVVPVLKAVWLASEQLCSKLLKTALPEWLAHYERRFAPLAEAFKEQAAENNPRAD